MDFDEVIRSEYVVVNKTVDDLLCDPDEATRFADRINARLDAHGPIQIPRILRRLVYLRKNNGLPRIRRAK